MDRRIKEWPFRGKDKEWFALQLEGTDLVLDIAGSRTKKGTKLIVYPYEPGKQNQLWRYTANGCYQAKISDLLVLDVSRASTKPGASLITWPGPEPGTAAAVINQQFTLPQTDGQGVDAGPIHSLMEGLSLGVYCNVAKKKKKGAQADDDECAVKPGAPVVTIPSSICGLRLDNGLVKGHQVGHTGGSVRVTWKTVLSNER